MRVAMMAGAALAMMGAGTAQAASRSYNLSGFDQVLAANHVNVVVRQGPFSVVVEEPQGRFGELELVVRNGTLIAARKSQQFRWFGWGDGPHFRITVTAPAYSGIAATNHSDVRAEVSADRLKLSADNHSDLSGAFNARLLSVSADNHADIRYSGRCGELSVRAGNHADIDGAGLDCGVVNGEAHNHADLTLRASNSVSCTASNHADVWIYGKASATALRSSNHASIHRR